MLVVELTSEIILLSLVARSITGRYHLSKVECENDADCLNHEKAEELHITRFCRSNGVRSVCQCRHDYFADGEICKPLTSVSDLPCDKANASKTCTDVRFETECGEDASKKPVCICTSGLYYVKGTGVCVTTGEVSRATSLTCSMAKKDCPWIDIATGEQTGLDSTTCVEPAQRHFCACKDGYASFNGACVFVGPSTASATRSGSTSWLLALRAALWLNCNL